MREQELSKEIRRFELRRMTKVHPNATEEVIAEGGVSSYCDRTESATLTVWKKSLLFNCNGFTVFDPKGNLLFRVDNYASDHKGQLLLMDASGHPLLTLRRKRLSLGEQWQTFEGELASAAGCPTRPPKFTVKKQWALLCSRDIAHVFSRSSKSLLYEIQGSYSNRCCAVFDDKRRKIAEIKRKEAAAGGVAFGSDVFRLIVLPEMDTVNAMALVLLLDQMFSSRQSSFNA